jgi:hypothetical protein
MAAVRLEEFPPTPQKEECLDNASNYTFCKLKNLYMVKTFVSLLYGHAAQLRIYILTHLFIY